MGTVQDSFVVLPVAWCAWHGWHTAVLTLWPRSKLPYLTQANNDYSVMVAVESASEFQPAS
ncbi:hypothetical protein L209DRAFT_756869 [Thermothelomyces heterothallicus CBS 203.75]